MTRIFFANPVQNRPGCTGVRGGGRPLPEFLQVREKKFQNLCKNSHFCSYLLSQLSKCNKVNINFAKNLLIKKQKVMKGTSKLNSKPVMQKHDELDRTLDPRV